MFVYKALNSLLKNQEVYSPVAYVERQLVGQQGLTHNPIKYST